LITQNDREKSLERSKDSNDSKNESTIFQNIFMNNNQINNIINKTNYRRMNTLNKKINNNLVNKKKDKSSINSQEFKINYINNYLLDNTNNNYVNNNIDNNVNNNVNDNINNNDNNTFNNNNQYIKRQLFPYKYYLCTIFIKNINLKKKSIFFSKKFLDVYNFICQLIDISSYLILQREFEVLKNTLMIGKYKNILENKKKINVNDRSFNIDMKECLNSQKFSILGRFRCE
jgi:hypothetical protein